MISKLVKQPKASLLCARLIQADPSSCYLAEYLAIICSSVLCVAGLTAGDRIHSFTYPNSEEDTNQASNP